MNVRQICAVPMCFSPDDTPKNYFRFPKEYDRWLQWVHACGRLDLVSKGPEYAYRNCRLCHLHFESKWYKRSKTRTYLNPDALPTIFFQVGCEQQNGTIIRDEEEEKAVVQEGDGNSCPKGTAEVQEENSNEGTSKLFPPIGVVKLEAAEPTSTERPDNVNKTSDTPKVKKLLRKCKKLKAQNRSLRERIRRFRLEKKKETTTVGDECGQLKKLGRKLLPHNLYEILEAQIDTKLKSKRGRRYDTEFKRFALSLYLLSPRTYKQIEHSIALPSVRSLQLFTKKWDIVPALNAQIFEALKYKLKSLPLMERHCIG